MDGAEREDDAGAPPMEQMDAREDGQAERGESDVNESVFGKAARGKAALGVDHAFRLQREVRQQMSEPQTQKDSAPIGRHRKLRGYPE